MVFDLVVQQSTLFDYSEYPEEASIALQRHAATIREIVERSTDVVARELYEAKQEIHRWKKAGWAEWVETEVGWSVQYADRLIRRYQEKNSETQVQNLLPEAAPRLDLPLVESSQETVSPSVHIELAREVLAERSIGISPLYTTFSEVATPRNEHVMQVMGSSESPEWYTPQDIVQLSIALLGEIDLDPCSNSHESPNIPAHNHYTKEDDGLSQPWEGKVYLNPPYGSEIPQWVDKLVKSYGNGVTEAIALLPGRIDTVWFQPLYEYPMCNIRGRLQFENSPHHAPFPCVIVYLGKRTEDFIKVFKDRGPIMRRIG